MSIAEGLRIREYAEADEPAAFALMEALNRHEASQGARRRTGPEAATDCLAEDAAKAAAGHGGRLVMETADGEIIAYATYVFGTVPAFMPGAGRPELFVENLVVAENARGRGCGRAILAELRRRAEAVGAVRLVLHVVPGNTGAIHAYGQIGFRTSALEMEWPLA